MKSHRSTYYKGKHDSTPKDRFKKSLSKYLSFNLFIFIFMILGMGGAFLMKISVIWGAFLALKLYRISNSSEEHHNDRSHEKEEDRRSRYGRPRRPEWKDKDLV